MILDHWEQFGKVSIDETNPQHKEFRSRVGERNVETSPGQWAPYVLDIPGRKVTFAGDRELRLTSSGLEFWSGGELKNTLSLNPEIFQGASWRRKNANVGGLAWVQGEDFLDVSYTVSTQDFEGTITLRAGRGSKVHMKLGLKALKAGTQRMLVEFDEKGTRGKRKAAHDADALPTIDDTRINFAGGTWWGWEDEEDADHDEIDDDPGKTKIKIKEKDYVAGEEHIISPDTWGETDIQANTDDGGEDNKWEVNGTYTNFYYIYSVSGPSDENFGVSWTLPAIADGATINKFYISCYAHTDVASGTTGVLRTQDSDPATAVIWSSTNKPSDATWINTDLGSFALSSTTDAWYFGEGDVDAKNLAQDLTDLQTSYGAIASGDRVNVAGVWVSGTTNTGNGFEDYNHAGTNVATLYIDWTEGGLTGAVTDGVKVGDTAAGVRTISAAVTDGLKVGDTPKSALETAVATTDGVKVGDTTAVVTALSSATTDGVKVGDTAATQAQFNPAVTDGVKVGDTPAALANYGVSTTDGAKIGDTAETLASHKVTTTDGVKVGDATDILTAISVATTDGVKVGDIPATLAQFSSATIDGVKVGDTPATLANHGVATTDGVKIGDATDGELAAAISGAVTDGAKIGDTAKTVATFGVATTDGVKAGDVTDGTLSTTIAVSVTDGIKLGEEILNRGLAEDLEDTDLVVRYYNDEAASGTAPTAVVDRSSGTAANLTLNYDSQLAYTESSGNRGLVSSSTGDDQYARYQLQAADKLITNLNGATVATMEIVADLGTGAATVGRVFALNDGTADTEFGLTLTGTDAEAWVGEAATRSWTRTTGRKVYHIVMDTSEPTNDQVKIYIDGVRQTVDIDAAPSALGVTSTHKLYMFNRGDNTPLARSFTGTIYYGAIYAKVLTRQTLWDHFDILTVDDDFVIRTAKTDGVKIGDSCDASLTGALSGSATDGVKVGDVAAVLASYGVETTDGVKLADTGEVQARFGTSTLDGVKLGDTTSASLAGTIAAAVLDGIKVADSSVTQASYLISTVDGVKIGDEPQTLTTYKVTVVDGTKIGDITNAELAGALTGIVADGLKVGDAAEARAAYGLSITDGVLVGDEAIGVRIVNVAAVDGIKLGDIAAGEIAAAQITGIVADGIKVGDVSATAATFDVVATDGVKLADQIETVINWLVATSDGVKLGDTVERQSDSVGLVTVTFTSTGATITFTGG